MVDGIDLLSLALLCVAALAAGWVDAVSGGGGLLQLPALLVTLPESTAPAQALGTNKLSSIVGTSAAARAYARRVTIDLRTAIPMAVAAFAGSAVGSAIATQIAPDFFRPFLLVLLIGVWVFTLVRPAMGVDDRLRWDGRRHRIAATVAGAVIGTYDGLVGPGTGTFLLIALVAGLGYSFLSASATAKLVNLGTNAASLIVFGFTGNVLWLLGLAMGICNLVGAVVGARMAIAKGSGFVRIVFLGVVAVLIIRLAFEVL